MSEILVVGSVAYDTIQTPLGRADQILGGSANYFSLAASLYSKVNVVGVVGEDYRDEDWDLLTSRNVNVDGLKKVPGKTFHWEGKYEGDLNEAITMDTQLNVFEHFDPQLPESYKSSKFVFLANIDPLLQMKVLKQVSNPELVGLDTMNLWINNKKEDLLEAIKQADILLINEGEAKVLAQDNNTVGAILKLSKLGPKGIVVKRGEYGFMMYAEEQFFALPAFPVEKVIDPTGAGDTFAGGFFGYLAKVNEGSQLGHLKQACVHGCILASFTVEEFGVTALKTLSWERFERRLGEYQKIIT